MAWNDSFGGNVCLRQAGPQTQQSEGLRSGSPALRLAPGPLDPSGRLHPAVNMMSYLKQPPIWCEWAPVWPGQPLNLLHPSVGYPGEHRPLHPPPLELWGITSSGFEHKFCPRLGPGNQLP